MKSVTPMAITKRKRKPERANKKRQRRFFQSMYIVVYTSLSLPYLFSIHLSEHPTGRSKVYIKFLNDVTRFHPLFKLFLFNHQEAFACHTQRLPLCHFRRCEIIERAIGKYTLFWLGNQYLESRTNGIMIWLFSFSRSTHATTKWLFLWL